jgi:recombination protein RecT
MATAAEETANPVAVIRQNLTAMAPEFKAALPSHVSVEKFSRVAMTAIQNTPALVNADRRSLFGAFVRLAQDGLLPDGREAAIVMFGNKAQAMPMIAGILKKIRQSGEVAKVSAQVVYENDEFVISYGFDEDVKHIPPKLNEPRGEPIGAYATAVLKDGSQLLEVMSLEQIDQVRKVSRASGNGPWVQWFGEMARKTVMRRLSKRLPMSTDLEDEIFSRDETMRPNLQPVERTIEAVRETAPVSRLDAIEHQIDPPVEPEVIAEQAEELEAEIEEVADAEIGLDDVHPGKAIADAIIAEIEAPECNAVMDVANVLTKHTNDIAALTDADGVRVEIAASKRRESIRAAQAKAKAGSKESVG